MESAEAMAVPAIRACGGGGAQLSISAVPDEVLVAVLEAHPSRCQLRALAPRLRHLVEAHFQIRHFEPPAGKVFSVDFEINQHMTKHLYCAKFGGESAGDAGGVAGAVTFVNWIPAYYRSAPHASRDVRHRLAESDGCTLWRLLAKVRDQRNEAASIEKQAAAAATAGNQEAAAPQPQPRRQPLLPQPQPQPQQQQQQQQQLGAGPAAPWQLQGRPPKEGYLTITEGRANSACDAAPICKREVVGRLSPIETELVLSVLDHRRNSAAQPAPPRQEIFAA